MSFATRARNVFGRNTNPSAIGAARSKPATANPPLPAPQFRMPQRYATSQFLPAAQKARPPVPRRSIGAPRTGIGLRAPGVPGEHCWFGPGPEYARCCIYDGVAFPFCVTYPDVD